MFESFEELYATDDDLVNNGVPVTIGYNSKDEPMVLYIAQERNEKHIEAIRKREKLLEQMRHDEKGLFKLRCAIFAEGILMKWEGILDKKGKAIASTQENKAEALGKYRRLLSVVVETCSDPSNYRPKGGKGQAAKDSEGN